MQPQRIIHLDGNEGTVTFERIQDVEPILEHNKDRRSEGQRNDVFHYVGEIPNVIIDRWLKEEWERGNTTIRLGGEEFQRLIMRKLRDPDWAWLRTTSKRL